LASRRPAISSRMPTSAPSTFNSLSRDHGITIGAARLHKRCPCLSTPSLGITYRGHPAEGCRDLLELSTPSLGITAQTTQVTQQLQDALLSTPSLGITQSFAFGPKTSRHSRTLSLSFNSLSRDHLIGLRAIMDRALDILTFNSLSRDHRARFRDFSALRGFPPRHPFAQMISKATIWIYRFAPL
jgi:hypothetical protein